MPTLAQKIVAGATIIVLIFFGVLLHKKTSSENVCKKLTVVCTTSIIADTVRAVAGECVTLIALMGPGVDPHMYRASEGDVHRLANADLIFYNGLHLEGKMSSILAHMPAYAPTVAVTETIARSHLRSSTEFPESYDPHVWLDVPLWQHAVQRITDALVERDPSNAATYAKNSHAYLTHLEELNTYVLQRAQEIPHKKRILITAHDAFGYFGARYGFKVIGLQGMSTEAQASIGAMQHLVDFIVHTKTRALFVESSISERAITAVQHAVHARGWQVIMGPPLYSDALGTAASDAATYSGMIKHNIDAIVDALKYS